MVHHSRWQRVIAYQIGDDAVVLHHVAVNDAWPREEPVAEILLIKTRSQVELVQILKGRIQRKEKKHVQRREESISMFEQKQSFLRKTTSFNQYHFFFFLHCFRRLINVSHHW